MIVVTPSNVNSCICIAAATTELSLLYPTNIELKASAMKLWNAICEANLLARIVWALRAKSALGIMA